jgi:hypothetical protein
MAAEYIKYQYNTLNRLILTTKQAPVALPYMPFNDGKLVYCCDSDLEAGFLELSGERCALIITHNEQKLPKSTSYRSS